MRNLKLYLFLLVYRYILAPISIFIYLVLVLPLSKKQRQLLKLRLNSQPRKPSITQDCIWFHAASGEFEYAKSLIRLIKQNKPNSFILVTYSSPSYASNIASYEYVDGSQPLPFDLVGPMSSFLRHYRPKALLLARSDLWPEMLSQCRKKNIPVSLFATSLHQSSGWLAKLWKRFNFSFIDNFFLNSESDIRLLQCWQIKGRLTAVGDPRFDQAFYRKQNPKYLDQFSFSKDAACLIAGSTWPEDEDIILDPIIKQIKQGHLNFIIAPHELHEAHLKKIQSKFAANQISYDLLSQVGSTPIESPVLIIDKMGVLADFYKFADFSFIGGSFKKRVHSVMESLVNSKPVILGPYYKNNPEALIFKDIEFTTNQKAVEVAHTKEAFTNCLQLFIDNYKASSNSLDMAIELHKGAAERILANLDELKIINLSTETP